MSARTGRTAKSQTKSKLRITERDLWTLEALTKMRFTTTSQLATLFFKRSRWSANKRLRKLLDAGFVNVWVKSLSEENIYSIARKGLGAIEGRSKASPKRKIPYGLDENLEHLLAINDVRTSLAVNLPQANAEIVWWRSDWELRSHGRERIIPDGLFLIRWHGIREHAYALEVDNNTRSARNFLKKILAYVSSRSLNKTIYGIADPTILVAGCDPKWLDRYSASIKNLSPSGRIWFATIEDIKREAAMGSIWINGTEQKCSLRELN